MRLNDGIRRAGEGFIGEECFRMEKRLNEYDLLQGTQGSSSEEEVHAELEVLAS